MHTFFSGGGLNPQTPIWLRHCSAQCVGNKNRLIFDEVMKFVGLLFVNHPVIGTVPMFAPRVPAVRLLVGVYKVSSAERGNCEIDSLTGDVVDVVATTAARRPTAQAKIDQ